MKTRELLSKVEELNLASKVKGMNATQFDAFVTNLNIFTDKYPEHEMDVKIALESKDYAACSRTLEELRSLLVTVHAERLAQQCAQQLKALETPDEEKIEAGVTLFLSSATALSIDIQMALNTEEEVEEEPVETSAESENDGTISILAVDDSSFFLNIFKSYLKDTGYKITCMNSGNSAVRFIQSNTPSLFVLDIEMPDINGFDLAEKIKKAGQKAPIIFLTANATKKNIVRAIRLGAVDFIVKPSNKDQVIKKIAKHLQSPDAGD